MSYEFRPIPRAPGEPECFSIGRQSMELDEDVLKEFGLRPVLDRIGAALLKQYEGRRTSGGKKVVGFTFHSLELTLILEDEKAKV